MDIRLILGITYCREEREVIIHIPTAVTVPLLEEYHVNDTVIPGFIDGISVICTFCCGCLPHCRQLHAEEIMVLSAEDAGKVPALEACLCQNYLGTVDALKIESCLESLRV